MSTTAKKKAAKKAPNKKAVGGKKTEAYRVRVSGQYHARAGDGSTIKLYEDVEFFLPPIVDYPLGRVTVYKRTQVKTPDGSKPKRIKVSKPKIVKANVENCAPYVIKNFYIEAYLRRKYEGFISVRTYEIVSIDLVKVNAKLVANFSDISISEMSEVQLLQYCVANDLRVQLALYPKIMVKRQIVKKAYNKKVEENKKLNYVEEDEDDVTARPKDSMVEEVELDDVGDPIETDLLE